MKKKRTELVFILDKSGSMSGLETDSIGGYNSMLAQQRALTHDCLITTVLFDNECLLLHDRLKLTKVKDMTHKDYLVGGSTALLDAIGQTIQHMSQMKDARNVLFVIITDGQENASRQFTVQTVKRLLEQQKEAKGWEYIFLGANIDAVETASRMGISPDHAADFLSDSEGTHLNYQVIADTITTYRTSGKLDEQLMDKIREDVQQRKH